MPHVRVCPAARLAHLGVLSTYFQVGVFRPAGFVTLSPPLVAICSFFVISFLLFALFVISSSSWLVTLVCVPTAGDYTRGRRTACNVKFFTSETRGGVAGAVQGGPGRDGRTLRDDKTVRVHAEFDLALERVAGIVVG